VAKANEAPRQTNAKPKDKSQLVPCDGDLPPTYGRRASKKHESVMRKKKGQRPKREKKKKNKPSTKKKKKENRTDKKITYADTPGSKQTRSPPTKYKKKTLHGEGHGPRHPTLQTALNWNKEKKKRRQRATQL